MITRCPNCQTTFRISEEQRRAAGGQVRCGVCTRVFRADPLPVAAAPGADRQPNEAPGRESSIEEDYIRELLGAGNAPKEAQTLDVVESNTAAEIMEHAAAEMPECTAGHTAADPASDTPVCAPEPPAESTVVSTTVEIDRLPTFAPPPLEIETAPTRHRARRIGWVLTNMLALLALAAQYGWQERTRVLENPGARHWLERACTWVGCALPPPRAVAGAIRSEALSIRPAPGRDGVLLVDALLGNHAAYPQPWPALAISFQDMHGRTLAGRVFGPGEYLPGPPDTDMPTGSVHAVHLELHDPGEHATGYRMEILPPETAR